MQNIPGASRTASLLPTTQTDLPAPTDPALLLARVREALQQRSRLTQGDAFVVKPAKKVALSLDVGPTMDARVKQEAEAFMKFLDRHWDVAVKRDRPGARPLQGEAKRAFMSEIIAQAIRAGFSVGRGAIEANYGEVAASLNRRRKLDITFQPSARPDEVDGETVAKRSMAQLTAGFRVDVAPKRYDEYKKTAREYAEMSPEGHDFTGTGRHRLSGQPPGPQLARDYVYNRELRGHSPLETLLTAAVLQGGNLVLHELADTVRARLDALDALTAAK
jgi:hypothetical protein